MFQTFVCEVRHADSGDLATNRSTTRGIPAFSLTGLSPAGSEFRLDLYSVNAKGRSEVVRLAARTRPAHRPDVVKYAYSAGLLAFDTSLYPAAAEEEAGSSLLLLFSWAIKIAIFGLGGAAEREIGKKAPLSIRMGSRKGLSYGGGQ